MSTWKERTVNHMPKGIGRPSRTKALIRFIVLLTFISALTMSGVIGTAAKMPTYSPSFATASANSSSGYIMAGQNGSVYGFNMPTYGSLAGTKLNKPIVGVALDPATGGYWMVASDGGIFSFNAPYFGSMGGTPLNKPIVGMASTPDGKGYWMVASDGGIFSFGDATFYGSTGAMTLNKPIVGMASTPDGKGYWMVASDGGIFSFGDATFYGSTGAMTLNKPIVGMASTPDGKGYWMVASDGGIFSFGDATFYGSTGAMNLNKPIVGMASTPDGKGYWMVASDGGIFSFGDATFYGSMGGKSLAQPIVGIVSPTLAIPARAPAPTPLTITTTSLPNATVGSSYSATLAASGGTAPYSWTVTAGSLPSGLNLSLSGVITGMPSSQGSSSVTVRVTDSTTPTPQATTATLSISVSTTSTPIIDQNPNWSGYIVGNGPYTAVTGTFSVPSLQSGVPCTAAMGEWVGIDGYGNSSLIQAGIGEDCDPNNPSLFYIHPWWEILPALSNTITSVSVAPGDQITVTIGQRSGTDWAITLTDNTNGETFTTDQTYAGPGSSAEWIVEAPQTATGIQTTLAPYSPDVNFNALRITGSDTSLTEAVMVQNGHQVSTPSALTSSGFNVAYGAVAPAAP